MQVAHQLETIRRKASNFLARGIAYQYFQRRAPVGCDVMTEDWDNLYLLDACRYDMFADQNQLSGTLDSRISKGPTTPEFLEANFANQTHYDTIYVTANPIHAADGWCSVALENVFHEVIDVWKDGWDEELGTVPPEVMTESVLDAAARHPNKRLFAHFIQPHHPFIGASGRSLIDRGWDSRAYALDTPSDSDNPTVGKIWDRLEEGLITTDRVWQAYTENLDLVWPHLEKLFAEIDGKTVVTSDHGNLVGERLWPFPRRGYGHPHGLYAPKLIKVPWLICDGSQRREIVPELPSDGERQASSDVVRRLTSLGYT